MSSENEIQHVNIMVDDLAAAIAFYGTELGLVAIPTVAMDFPAQFFKINDVQEIHINELHDSKQERAHFCLRLSDFTSVFLRMKAIGAIETKTWGNIRRLPNGVVQMFVRDPAGNLIELSCTADQYVDPSIYDESIFEPNFLELQ